MDIEKTKNRVEDFILGSAMIFTGGSAAGAIIHELLNLLGCHVNLATAIGIGTATFATLLIQKITYNENK